MEPKINLCMHSFVRLFFCLFFYKKSDEISNKSDLVFVCFIFQKCEGLFKTAFDKNSQPAFVCFCGSACGVETLG